jgi:hypothetical protein
VEIVALAAAVNLRTIPHIDGDTIRAARQTPRAVEGLNKKIRVVTRRSYGFRIYKAMEIALYHNLGRLPQPESTHRVC